MKYFNQYLILLIFLTISFSSKAQFDEKRYDKESFLIGTLNEYMGYQRTFSNGDNSLYQRVDIMRQENLKKVLFIDSLFSINYPDITIVNNGAPLGIKLYSPTLSLKIDDYYNYKPQLHWTSQGDTTYSGELKKEKFETEKQKLSFLLGAYLSYGVDKDITNLLLKFHEKDNNLDGYENISVSFSMPNAPTKAQTCVEILKDLGCNNVEYFVLKEYIPVGYQIIFIPTKKIQKVIDEAVRLREYIETINTDDVEFTPEGTKFIWDEPKKL